MIRDLLSAGLGCALLVLTVPAQAAGQPRSETVVPPRAAPKVMLPGDSVGRADTVKAPPKGNSASRTERDQTLPHPFREQVAEPEARA